MYSDAVSIITETNVAETKNGGAHADDFRRQRKNKQRPSAEVFAKWKNWQPSQISHHGGACCDIACEWLTATDFSELGGGSRFTGPRWLRQRFNWGASSFPIYWCEAVRRKTLDCGALAALAHEVFTARGIKSFRVQLVQRFSRVATKQWSHSWRDDGDSRLRWINKDLIYHEGCAIAVDNKTSILEIKVWDASAGWWIDPKAGSGYGSLLAIKLSAPVAEAGNCFKWGSSRCLAGNLWQKIS